LPGAIREGSSEIESSSITHNLTANYPTENVVSAYLGISTYLLVIQPRSHLSVELNFTANCERGYQGFHVSMSDFQQNFIKMAIETYGLELDPDRVDAILETWLKQYDPTWILKAIVESLYRGRYKIVSVENILKDWQRLGNPRYQFTPEYERDILEKVPQPAPRLTLEVAPLVSMDIVAAAETPVVSLTPLESHELTTHQLTCQLPLLPPVLVNSEHLNPEESAPFQSHHHSLSISHSTVQVDVDRDSSVEQFPDLDFNDNSLLEDGNVAKLVLPINLVQRRGKLPIPDRVKLERNLAQPARYNLFNTLKAIVDPNNQNSETVRDAYTFPPLVAGNSKIASFTLPIDIPSEERQF
jgi:hypothetical protein